jgi:hypothetical protein
MASGAIGAPVLCTPTAFPDVVVVAAFTVGERSDLYVIWHFNGIFPDEV